MKIAHVSDTHLGRRIKKGRNDIINQETRPVESDFYDAWEQVVDEITSSKPDIVIHSGDFFDNPSGIDRSAPPEYARRIAAKTFKKIQEAGIPFVIVDGNHGRYFEYRSSTLSEYADTFDNIHLFSHYDVRDAIREQKPLYRDFPDLELRVIAHPSLEVKMLNTLGIDKQYEKWVSIQTSSINPDMINVAVVHGSTIDGTLHPNFLKGGFDYIALGHNHKMETISENAWYAGSTERWIIDEFDHEKGFLYVDVRKGKAYPTVTKKMLNLPRRVISEEIELNPDDTTAVFLTKVNDIFKKHNLEQRYDYETAARIRIVLKGNITFGSSLNLGDAESFLRHKTLDSDELNIVEFSLVRPETKGMTIGSKEHSEVTNVEYLVEDPESEFKQYVTSKRKEALQEQNLDPNILAKIFANVLREETA
ncbi:metallophosphoesterase family protein [Candidatus Nitrosotenuis uzonensis]|uniref:Putative DNA double-strand break repair protein Mre11 n=1 Tax=Candidatus Nitrosotenuis uzonensis TaxID=1407055 RepID=A0A812ETW2_9ARCH|nr:metallophosphoesterase [Candidatus Nitrosotenuis uzonensis]CAE6485885.1 putative DNA double-strand break repair protein Mre11 [Candidatus Nitrosotenuis uzonensis]